MNGYIPVIFVLIVAVVLLNSSNRQQHISRQSKRRKEQSKMDNSLLSAYIGKECIIQANGYISGVVGKVTAVQGNWISVEDKKGKLTTVNCDYVSSIREK